MSKGFSVDDILGAQSKAQAVPGMVVVQLPIEDIIPNPDNEIYNIGDVSMLVADIADKGLRQALEVIPVDGGKYMLIAGHRRWTACHQLYDGGDKRFARLPAVVKPSEGADEDLISLITSNATARELTDGERLKQYRALKGALERKKAAGHLEGRVRAEMVRLTGDGAGTLARLNAICEHCIPEVIQMVEAGEVGLSRAYDCSKLYKVQQLQFAQKGWANMPRLSDQEKAEAMDWLVTVGCKEFLSGLDYQGDASKWSFIHSALPGRMTYELFSQQWKDEVVYMPGGWRARFTRNGSSFNVEKMDVDDSAEVLADCRIEFYDMFSLAKKLYRDKEAEKQKKTAAQEVLEKEKRDKETRDRRRAMAWEMLNDIDNWELVGTVRSTSDLPADAIKVEIRRHVLWGGGWVLALYDPASCLSYWEPGKHVFKYSIVSWLCIGPDGKRQNMESWERPGPYSWNPHISIERFLTDRLEKVEAGNGDD